MKNATFIAESISITCPYCGAALPGPGGSDQWLPHELRALAALRDPVVCNDCEESYTITMHNKAHILPGEQ